MVAEEQVNTIYTVLFTLKITFILVQGFWYTAAVARYCYLTFIESTDCFNWKSRKHTVTA